MRRQTELSFSSHIFPKLLLSHGEMSSRNITPWNTARQREIQWSMYWGETQEDMKRCTRWGLIPSSSSSDGGVQREKWVWILTLCSNPITLPNWIGYVHCSDRIRAVKRALAQGWGEPFGPPFLILFGLQTVKAIAKKNPTGETAPVEL